ncbi:MAG: radical SAM protein [Clostridia bacterium]|nr:radical SAM protein [Clostridia bacterium]
MKKYNVALFVPHAGCPHQCAFCNQKSISGKLKSVTPEDVEKAVKVAVDSAPGSDGEIAFFGGSFTAVDRTYMLTLLQSAKKFVSMGLFKGIRISTRPDAVDEEICNILKENLVTSVELGCQSMDDEVLLANRRGHTAKDVENATRLLKKYGFEVGHQMMTGLYKSSCEKDIETAEKIIALSPDTVRIYPTVVLENTALCRLYRQGEYEVMSERQTVALCAELLEMFEKNNIPVIRMGLHSGGGVEDGYVAGFYHPAFRQLCESEIYLKKILREIEKCKINKGNIIVKTAPSAVSSTIGQKKSNLLFLKERGYSVKVVPDGETGRFEVKVEEKI